jgi:hypothetical protein
MQEIKLTLPAVHVAALDAALRAVCPKVIGVSLYSDGAVSVWLEDTASDSERAAVQASAAAHDPVFLTADRAAIAADDTDTAAVHVRAPHPAAAAVTLLVGGQPVPVALTAGEAVLWLSSADPVQIVVTLQQPANRTTDSLVISAA